MRVEIYIAKEKISKMPKGSVPAAYYREGDR